MSGAGEQRVNVARLPRAHGEPVGQAVLRESPGDFRVDEDLGFEPTGSGEHLMLRVRKTDRTTEAAAQALARWLGVPPRDVGYAGLKDKRAVTSQWFSVSCSTDPAPGPLPEDPAVEVLELTRNARKLRRGALSGNRFIIRLSAVQGRPAVIGARLLRLSRYGVPNYFGAQRFGVGGRNVADARAMLAGTLRVRNRHRRSLFLSAARSHLFNMVLAERVGTGSWSTALPGELVMLEGSNSVFEAQRETPPVLARRLAAQDLHPTGPMPGRGGAMPTAQALQAETTALRDETALAVALEAFGVAGMRRALRMQVAGLHWHWPSAQTLEVGFRLSPGSYATMVLREVLELSDPGDDGVLAAA